MCAALALAHAGVETKFGHAAADALLNDVESRGGAAMVRGYKQLGWQVDLCDVLRRTNDATPESARSESLSTVLLSNLE